MTSGTISRLSETWSSKTRVQFICRKHKFSQSKRIDLKVEGDAEKAVAVVKREKTLGQSSGHGEIIQDRQRDIWDTELGVGERAREIRRETNGSRSGF